MNPIEKLLNIIAPEHCIECGQENFLLCPGCYYSIPKLGSICFVCQKATQLNQPCEAHNSKFAPNKVFCINKYETTIKDHLVKYKFETRRFGGAEIAKYMNEDLPFFDNDYVVSWVPTTAKRIRQNGYDHSFLIAKNFAKHRGLKYKKTIERVNSAPLHNLNKQDRIKAIKNYYQIIKQQKLIGKKILIIDDIATTGATINYASKILKKAGASEIIACVFAKTF